MTDKLTKVKEYVVTMSPIYRPAVLFPPVQEAFNRGYDIAMQDAQRALLAILEADDDQ